MERVKVCEYKTREGYGWFHSVPKWAARNRDKVEEFARAAGAVGELIWFV